MADRMKATQMDIKQTTILDNMNIGNSNGQAEEGTLLRRTDMDMPKRASLRDSTTGTARKIDSTILATSKGQAEPSNHHLMDQDRTDHRRYQPTIRIIRDNLLGLRIVMQGMGTLSLCRVNAMSRIQGMDMTIGGPFKMLEIARRRDHLHHSQMADPVSRRLRFKTRRRVQWKSGRPKRKRRCTRLPTSQKSYHKTMPSPRSGS